SWRTWWAYRLGHLSPSSRFLVCWIAVYLVFFSCSRTKLPNYILPAYPAVALFLGQYLDRWRRGEVRVPDWFMRVSFLLIAMIGVLIVLGLSLAGGRLGGEALLHGRHLPGLELWAFLGLIPFVSGILLIWYTDLRRRNLAIGLVAGTAFSFAGLLSIGPVGAVDLYKAPRPLAAIVRQQQTDPEFRIATYRFFHPSLVFYCGREVTQFPDELQVLCFLRSPLPVYLFVPAAVWDDLQNQFKLSYAVLGKHWDLYRNCEVVLITNQ
ncbi:MAG: hypothetical protein ACJ8FY_06510, partial [Gemmataceae bacterium]